MTGFNDEMIRSNLAQMRTRWITIAVSLITVLILGSLTFGCADRRRNEIKEKTECVKAGGSWIPIQGIRTGNNNRVYPDYEMGCVSAAAQQGILQQNSKIIEQAKSM